MLSTYIPIVVMVAAATLVGFVMVLGALFLGPRKPTRYKITSYECGMVPVGSARERFPVRFYLIAMLFIIFDIETVFLYPWAVAFGHGDRAWKLFNLGEMGVFAAILFIGYFYLLGKGALDWETGQAMSDGAAGEPTGSVLWPRPPIRFGNEGSGPVALPPIGDRKGRVDA